MVKNIMCIDMALANVGIAVFSCDSEGSWTPLYSELVTTEKSDKKKSIRAAEDDVRRATEVYKVLKEIKDTYDVVGIAAEVPTGSQNARASELLGMAKGILASFSVGNGDLLVEWVTPNEVKMATCKCKSASKRDMIDAADKLYPTLLDQFRKKNGDILNKAEHVADACGVFNAIKGSNMYNMVQLLAK